MTTIRVALAVALALLLTACPGEDPPGDNNSNNGTANNTANNEPNNEPNNDSCTDTCDVLGFSCDGNVLVECRAATNGCRRDVRIDCDPSGRVCDADSGLCSSSTCNDEPVCIGATAGQSFCDETRLVTCTDDGFGCLSSTLEDCSSDGRICSDEEQACVSTCVDEPQCAGSTDGGMTCSDDGLSMVTCVDSDEDGCLEVDETLDCTTGLECVTSGVDAMCVDVCGNGTVTGDEVCDDGNANDDDGCSSSCEPDLFGECDATGMNCIAYKDLGSFGLGDAIGGVSGSSLDGFERYKITFEDWLYVSGSWSNPDGSTLYINLYNEFDYVWLSDRETADGSWVNQGIAPGSYIMQVRSGTPVTSYTVSLSSSAPTSIGTFAANAPIPDTDGPATSFEDPAWYLITLTDDVVLDGTIKGLPLPAKFTFYGADHAMLRGSLGEDTDKFQMALFSGTYFFRVVPRAGEPLTSFSLPALSTDPLSTVVTDLGVVAAGDTIADQSANLNPGQGTFFRAEFTTPVVVGRSISPGTPLIFSVYDDAGVRHPSETLQPGEYIVAFNNDGPAGTGDITISLTATAP